MVAALHREQVLDLTTESLGPGWLRRRPTWPETQEVAGDGVWRTGPKLRFREELVTAIERASDVVQLCSFLLADDRIAEAILRAAQRGLRVYILTSSEQRLGKVVREDERFEQSMVEQHKKLLESLAGRVLLRSAEHIHAKFLVVDPHAPSKACAWLSTANLNRALEDSMELGVRLEAKQAIALANCFNWAFWCETERELRGPRRLLKAPPAPAVPPKPEDDAVYATLREGTRLRERVVSLVQSGRREILVASYGISADHPAVHALVEAASRGVRVTVLTRPRPAVAAGVAALSSAGATILAHDKLHAKAIAVDGQVLVMSANLESQGLDSGFEVGAVLPAIVAPSVEGTLREWAATFPWVYQATAKRGDHLGDFCPAQAGLRDGVVKVTEWHSQALRAVIASDALALDGAPAPPLHPEMPPAQLPRRVKFAWDVLPPTLPKGAVERFREVEREETDKDGKVRKTRARLPHDPRLFDHGGKVYVLLGDEVQRERAQQVAAALGANVVVR